MPPHFLFNALWLVCLHLCFFLWEYHFWFMYSSAGTQPGCKTRLWCTAKQKIPRKGAEYAKIGRLVNIQLNFCICVYKHLTLIQEQKCEADLASNILHLSKITVGTPRHTPHHNNTEYMVTRVQLTVTDTGLNYSFSYATEWRLSVLIFKFSAI